MFLSKIWFILIALVASVATTVALVAPRSATRQLASAEAQSLDRAQYAAEQLLKNEAIRWIHSVAKLGRDAVLTETLDNATRGTGEPGLLNETVKGRLGSLVPDLDGRSIRVLGAVDGNGRLVGRIGEGENERGGESWAGIEVIADALRGVMSDDVWAANGKLTRVAAAPVLSKTRDKVVGAVFVGLDTGDRMVELWKKNLGVDVAVLLGEQVLSATVPEGALGALAAKVAERGAEIKEAHRTKAFTLPHGQDEFLAVAAPFTGQAAALDARYVLMVKQTQAGGPLELLASTTKQDLGWAEFPWLRLGGAVLLMIGIGLFLQRKELEGPLLKLRGEMQKLARGEIHKLDDSRHPGRFGAIARDVNAALERHGDGSAEGKGGRKDLSAILGDRSTKSVDLPHLPPLGNPTGGFGPSKTPGGFSGPMPTPVSYSSSAPNHVGFGAAPSAFSSQASSGPIPGAVPAARLSSPPMPGGPRPPGPPPGGRPQAPLPPTPSAPMGLPPSFSPATARPTETTPTPTVPLPLGAPQGARGAMPHSHSDDAPTANMGQGAPASDPEDTHVREVFAEYVAMRSQTGEPTRGLTLEKFKDRLDENRRTIIAKYNCRSARFAVYLKDGKAAIRATPVKDA